MSRKVVFLRPAREELASAAEWYEDRRPGLGVELVAEIDEAVAQVSAQPDAWPLWVADRPYRKRVLDRFPYVVFNADEGGRHRNRRRGAHESEARILARAPFVGC